MRYAWLAVLAVVSSLEADEPVTIRLKLIASPNTVVTAKSTEKDTGSVKFYDETDKLLNDKGPEDNDRVVRTTTLELGPDGKPTRYLRTYDKATTTSGKGKEKAKSYQGQTLLFEKQKDDRFRISQAGTANITSDDLKKIFDGAHRKNENHEMRRQLDPKKPVRVGDSWAMEMTDIAASIDGAKVDLTKSKGTAKLTKVYKKGSATFGSFEAEAEITILSMSEDESTIVFDPPAVAKVQGKYDLAIDGSTTELVEEIKHELKGEAKGTLYGQKLRLSFNVIGQEHIEVSAESPLAKDFVVPKTTRLPAPGELIAFEDKALEFKAAFPGKPTRSENKTRDGSTTTSFSLVTGDGSVNYLIAVTKAMGPLDATLALRGAAANSKVENPKELKLDGYPGIEMNRRIKQGKVDLEVEQRVFVANDCLYQAVIVRAIGSKAESKKFFDAFHITKRAKDD